MNGHDRVPCQKFITRSVIRTIRVASQIVEIVFITTTVLSLICSAVLAINSLLHTVSTPWGVYGAEAMKKCAKIFLFAEYEFLREFEPVEICSKTKVKQHF